MKTCKNCKKQKPLSEFFKRNASPDGLQNNCKVCTYELSKYYLKTKKERDEDKSKNRILTLIGVTKNDYCNMYELLSKLGYNVEMDIYPQFAKKWSLLVSNDPRNGPENHFTYKDCKK